MDPPPLLPLFLRIADERCLLVGGGRVAGRKLNVLLRSGASVTLVAPELAENVRERIDGASVSWLQREFHDDDIAGHILVVAATDSVEVNEGIARLAKDRGVPVNVVNRPQSGTFVFPSIVDRDPVTIAVSTGGRSPAMARWLRTHLETVVPDRLGELASLIGRYRARVKEKFPDIEQRRRFWERALHGQLSEFLFHNRPRKAREVLDGYLALEPGEAPPGEVFLVGAGPGDPDLLTFRALRLIQQADTVLYDRLVSPPILELLPDHAERVYVGKARSQHSVPQEQINQRLVEEARRGRRVLRLKGGDPFIFGRGGEEIDGLAAQGIPFQVVPGITAASGCAAYAGIPLTHRDHAQSCVFVTGHTRDGSLNLNWEALVQPQQTIVVYMGLTGLDVLCRELIDRGMDRATPAALVERGTLPEQRVITATLSDLPESVEQAGARAPTLVIIGHVVGLHGRLGWFKP